MIDGYLLQPESELLSQVKWAGQVASMGSKYKNLAKFKALKARGEWEQICPNSHPIFNHLGNPANLQG